MRYSPILLFLIFVSCKWKNTQNQLFVGNFPTSLRDTPGDNSLEIGVLEPGETLTDLGETSDFESLIVLDDAPLQSPWLQVKTGGGNIGWVFGGALALPPASAKTWLLQKRMQCYFGKVLTHRRNQITDAPPSLSETDFAVRYRDLMALRDTLVLMLARRPEPGEARRQPDFSWLMEVLPGFIFQKVAEGTQPYLFVHYGFFRSIALKTNGVQDDAFIEACLTAFSADSIESFYPAWTFQYSDYEAASQLGTGAHLKMFRQIETALKTGPLFRPELMAFKEALLEDMIGKNSVYWQPKELILKELDQILNAGLTCLDESDRVALQRRRAMFEDPAANGVRVNLRGG